MRMMRIPVADATTPLVLSPMVDVTDAAFRSVAREWGADVTCSEMVSAVGLLHDNRAAWEHVAPWPGERPYGVQFMCGEPEEMGAAVRKLGTRLRPDFVDVNLGCPAPSIMKLCAGGFLMKDPKKAGAVVKAARDAADEVGIPHVSVKMRLGPDERHLTYLEVAKEAKAAGAAWATLHARTVAQGYSGAARWEHIARLVEASGLPIVGNGDLRTPEDVVRMRDTTGCAGFFIARAAMHDPTVFTRMRESLEGRPAAPGPAMKERLQTLLVYLERAESIGLRNTGLMRRQAMRFVAGGPGAKRLRVIVGECNDAAEIREAVAAELAAA
ncbi:MAG TPA: tRNA-dihydrouridine synthase family protein [Candidatus Thermoplasmatota archaeon]|nr:tRNA-dihydrouridine synthase family protein [Candidatus Thermoplasmatota archaeon]